MCLNRNIKGLGSVEMHTVYVVFLEFRTSFKLMKRGLEVIKSRLQPGERFAVTYEVASSAYKLTLQCSLVLSIIQIISNK